VVEGRIPRSARTVLAGRGREESVTVWASSLGAVLVKLGPENCGRQIAAACRPQGVSERVASAILVEGGVGGVVEPPPRRGHRVADHVAHLR
jgi:hypothetical protein